MPTSPPGRVIVIGAGIAGLTVAEALASRGREVVVLEARNRVGGRCHTVEGIDLGAHWIHGTEGNPLTNLARELSLPTLFVGGDSTYSGGWDQLALHGPDGKRLTAADKLRTILVADEVRDRLDALRRRLLREGGADMSLREALDRVLAGHQLGEAERAWLDWHITLCVRDDCAADTPALSFLWWDDGYEVYGYGDSVFVDGYGALAARLAAGLDVRLGQVVERIEHGRPDEPVRVLTARGPIDAAAVVVTVPLGVLKAGAIRFDPELPPRKQEAIARLGMGVLAKVALRFATPFWPSDQYVFGYVSPRVSEHPTMIVNLARTHRVPVLALLTGGDRGRALERSSEPAVREWAMTVVRDVFGAGAPDPIGILRTAWSEDPFARGSYSFLAVGATPADIEALAEPVGDRLFFAGEATYRHHWGAAHGAYASGLREAARMLDDASILPSRHFTENRRWREAMMRASRFFNAIRSSVSADQVEDRLAVLRASDVFSVVPPSELAVLAMMFDVTSFDDGAVICAAGDPASDVYVVAEGEVEVCLADGSVAAVLRRGGVVGEYGLFTAGVRTATMRSAGRTRTLKLDYQRFQRFLLAFPESTLALLRLTVDRLVSQVNVEAATGASERR